MSHEFHIGQKVVWLGPSGKLAPRPYRETTPNLSRDEIYTVRWICSAEFGDGAGPRLAIKIAERTRTFTNGEHTDYPYGPENFRPLDERRYDISIFQTMCAEAGRHAATPVKP